MLWITFSVWGKERLFVEKSVLFRRKKSFYRQKGVFFPQLLKLSTKKKRGFWLCTNPLWTGYPQIFYVFLSKIEKLCNLSFWLCQVLNKVIHKLRKMGVDNPFLSTNAVDSGHFRVVIHRCIFS